VVELGPAEVVGEEGDGRVFDELLLAQIRHGPPPRRRPAGRGLCP
jgi:hypothetical protein